jgi:hypothetical protein
MRSRRGGFFIKLILFGCFLFLAFLFFVRRNLKTDAIDFLNMCKVNMGNIERELFPERKRSFSLVKQETELKLLLPDPFANFTQAEWEEFWDLIYGLHGYDMPDNPRLPYIKRQLTLPELAEELKSRYDIFKKFEDQHWQEFWRIILKQRKLKQR